MKTLNKYINIVQKSTKTPKKKGNKSKKNQKFEKHMCVVEVRGMKEQPLVGQMLSPAETTRYRALAATANFLAVDRGELCAKELARHMATPTTTDWDKVVRLGFEKTDPGFEQIQKIVQKLFYPQKKKGKNTMKK